MKKIKYIIGLFFALALVLSACEEEDHEFGEIIAPSNISIVAEIVGQNDSNPHGDGTGVVNFTASSQNVISYKYIYDGKEIMAPAGKATLNFSQTGVHTYTVTVQALGIAGTSSTKSIEVDVLALYEAPADLLEMLHGDGEKTWRIKAEDAGHFGVGPADETAPIWWAANPFDKAGLGAYDDRIIFKSDGTLTYVTNNSIYGKGDPLEAAFGTAWELNSDAEFENYPIADFTDTWALTAPGGQETLTFGGNGYHGFYVGGDHSYQIIARSATEMSIKTVGADGLGWFGILTSEEPPAEEELSLVWSDEFDVDGTPDAAKWTYDLGAGGWGNGESQTYTDSAENAIVEGGVLKIIAKDDGAGGYTSARLKTQGLYSFTYGRIEVKAKLPSSQGTWPAIWMLGDSFSTIGWPKCGEIDVMEQTGADKNTTLGTLHWFDNSSAAKADYGETTTVENSTSEFHVYAMEWTDESLKIFVDDALFFEMANSAELPFNENFFMIFNIAMGGSLGGTIDPAFTEDAMEIDYVRVYQ